MHNRAIKVGTVEIELPDYLISLNQKEIDDIMMTSSDVTILACGIHNDGKLTIVTSRAEVKYFDPEKYHIPQGVYLPLSGGEKVYLPNNSTRWPGTDKGFFVDSKWLIEKSFSSLDDVSIEINNKYVGDVNLVSIKNNDT